MASPVSPGHELSCEPTTGCTGSSFPSPLRPQERRTQTPGSIYDADLQVEADGRGEGRSCQLCAQ